MTLTDNLSIAALAAAVTLGATAQTRGGAPEPQNQSIVTAEAAEAAEEAARASKQRPANRVPRRGAAHELGRGPDGRARGATELRAARA